MRSSIQVRCDIGFLHNHRGLALGTSEPVKARAHTALAGSLVRAIVFATRRVRYRQSVNFTLRSRIPVITGTHPRQIRLFHADSMFAASVPAWFVLTRCPRVSIQARTSQIQPAHASVVAHSAVCSRACRGELRGQKTMGCSRHTRGEIVTDAHRGAFDAVSVTITEIARTTRIVGGGIFIAV